MVLKVLLEGRTTEKLWLDRGSESYNKTFNSLLKERNIEIYSTYSDFKAVIIIEIK